MADEKWGFFPLLGGFCYFDEDRQLLQCNAISLVPSDCCLNFEGPITPSAAAMQELHTQRRMTPVTIDVLQEAGYRAFAWVNPNESIGGIQLSEEVPYPSGAFVYEMSMADPVAFALHPHPKEFVDQWHAMHGPQSAPTGMKKTNSKCYWCQIPGPNN